MPRTSIDRRLMIRVAVMLVQRSLEAIGIFGISLLTTASALAQEPKDEVIQELLRRVQALEQEVVSLRTSTERAEPKEANLTGSLSNLSKTSNGPDIANSEPAQTNSARFSFHGYADGSFSANGNGDSLKRFSLGEFVLFATARISPNTNALVETVLETDNQEQIGNTPVNLERLLLQYRPSEYFNVDLGVYRTAVGFYSTAFLRGSWLQAALTRPKLFAFEDDGGILPLHMVGVSLNGKIPSGNLGLHYVLEGGNTRNYGITPSIVLGLESHAAWNMAVYARPNCIPGWDLGFSSYHDKVTPMQNVLVDRSLWTVHAVYQANRLEFLNEGVFQTVKLPTGQRGSIPGFYSQVAYRLGPNWSPYFRFEDTNTYGTGAVGSALVRFAPGHTSTVGGLRYDFTDAVALKTELAREVDRLGNNWIRGAVQIAFTF